MLTQSKRKASIPWKRAKTIVIPIPKTGTKFRQYPDHPKRSCEVTASFQYLPLPRAAGWHWRIRLDTPMFTTKDPDPTGKNGALYREANSQENAIRRSLDEILRLLRSEVEIRRHHGQIEVASACAQAVWHVEQFAKYFQETGKFRTHAIVPGGKKPREEFDAEIDALLDSKPQTPSPKTEVQSPKPSTAIAVKSAVLEALPVETLSSEERRLLNQREREIERGAKAWLELGLALGEISGKRLYRATHATFEAYCSERWHIERSMAYGLIDAARKHQAAMPIAAKLKIEFTAESQLRPLKAVEESDLKAILQRAARLTPADADGVKRPTAKIIAQAVHEENTSPDDLKREREKNRGAGGARREALLHDPAAPKSALHFTSCRVPSLSDSAAEEEVDTSSILSGKMAIGPNLVDPVSPEYRMWNGQSKGYAPTLHDVRSDLTNLVKNWGHVAGFVKDLGSLLHSLAAEICGESTLLHGLTHSSPAAGKRRAK